MNDIKTDDVCIVFGWRSGLVDLGVIRFNDHGSQSWVSNLVKILR